LPNLCTKPVLLSLFVGYHRTADSTASRVLSALTLPVNRTVLERATTNSRMEAFIMWRCFIKFIRLSSTERWLAIRALMALAVAKMALAITRFAHKIMPLDAARKVVAFSGWVLPTPMPFASVEQIAWAVKAIGENVPGFGNCLLRAIALEALLKVAHHTCELRIGVAKTASGEFLAHAWIEKEGRVLVGEFKPGSFQPLT
jgi:hypothetical protein